MGKLYIGTSGYNYGDWVGRFYPEDLPQKQWLTFYSEHFNTIEINATFYRSFKRAVFENWEKKVGEDFVFTIKGSRFITHIKRLKDVRDEVNRFFEAAAGLGKKLSVVLWQLPGSFKNNGENKERLERFLQLLSKHHPRGVVKQHLGGAWGDSPEAKHVFELRDRSWFVKEVFDLLDQQGAGFVINDSPHFPSIEKVTGNFAYIRFHGPSALYSSSYSDAQLKAWARKINRYLKNYDVYAYFNNDVGGYAVLNAKTLKSLLE